MDRERPLEKFSRLRGLDLPTLASAEERSEQALKRLRPVVAPATNDDVAFVVFGSIARREMTTGSDIDWTLLVDGRVDPAHFESALDLENRLTEERFHEPGREGTFGGLAFSHDLVHRIGGGDDTNRNTTQRILLLLESRALAPDDAYIRVFRSVLSRYITEDWGWVNGRSPAMVPRFLQNDLARYWRTVAVDFAYKRRDRGGKGWALRTVKLRMSRKMTYAAGLLACFTCELEDILNGGSTESEPAQVALSHLEDVFSLPPLDILCRSALMRDSIAHATSDLLRVYEDFLAVLEDEDKRLHLKNLKPSLSASDPIYDACRGISHAFQDCLDRIFFDDDLQIARLTRIYGVF